MPSKPAEKTSLTTFRSNEAEQAVIGSFLSGSKYSGNAIRLLTASCFYDASHQRIFQAIRDMWDRGMAIDLVTVSNYLDNKEDIELASCLIFSYSTEYIEHYARIIRDMFIKRRTAMRIETATLELKETHSFDIGEVLGNLTDDLLTYRRQAEFFNVAMNATELTDAMLVDVDLRSEAFHAGRLIGIPSGWASFDLKTGGFEPGDLVYIAGRPSMGKCLGKGTKILMFDGELRAVEDINTDDVLMGVDSKPRNVLSLSRGQGMMYWIRQTVGIDYRVNENHILSLKRSTNEGRWKHGDIVNLPIIKYIDTHRFKGYKVAVDFPEQTIPLDPYFLGLWIGDGSSNRPTIFNIDKEIIDWLYDFAESRDERITIERSKDLNLFDCNGYRVTQKAKHFSPDKLESIKHNVFRMTIRNWRLSGKLPKKANHKSISTILRKLNLFNNKHIPDIYLCNSRSNRLLLLAGLMDSDGYYNPKSGVSEITMKSKNLMKNIKFLCDSLGYRTSLKIKKATIKDRNFSCDVYRLRFNGNVGEIPIKVERKKANNCKRDWSMTNISIEKDKIDDYYGFSLDGDGLFLLEDMTVTHNSDLILNIAYNAASAGHAVLEITLEMTALQVWKRITSLQTNLYRGRLRDGNISDPQLIALHQQSNQLRRLPLIVADRAQKQMRMRDIRSLLLEHSVKSNIKLVMIDYIGLITPPRAFSREREVAQISAELKALAQEIKIPVIAVSQLSRGVEMRDSRRPRLSDLRDSGALEQDADMIILLYRDSYYQELDNPTIEVNPYNDKIEINVAKNRHGEKFVMSDVVYNRAIGRMKESVGATDDRKLKAAGEKPDLEDLPF